MVRISPDVGRNRVVIQLSGSPSREHCVSGARELQESLSRLRPPVDVLSDIRELLELNALLVDEFLKLSEVLRSFGVRKVVRVVGRSAQAAVQLERLTRNVKGHTAHLAFSMQEAEQVFGK